jgi:hypothetical protein
LLSQAALVLTDSGGIQEDDRPLGTMPHASGKYKATRHHFARNELGLLSVAVCSLRVHFAALSWKTVLPFFCSLKKCTRLKSFGLANPSGTERAQQIPYCLCAPGRVRNLLFGFFVIAVLSLGQTSAQADTVTTFTSLSAWQAALGSTITTEDFSDATLAAGLSATFGPNASISGGLLTVQGQLAGFPTPSVFTFNPATSGFGGDFDLTPGGNGGGLDPRHHLQQCYDN